MFNRMTSTKFIAPSGLEALRAGRPRLRKRQSAKRIAHSVRISLPALFRSSIFNPLFSILTPPHSVVSARYSSLIRRLAPCALRLADFPWRPLRLCGYILEGFFFFRTWSPLRLCPSISLGVLRLSKDASHLSPGIWLDSELGRGCG